MVLLASDFDKSKYFKAADFGSKPQKFKIKSVNAGTLGVGDDKKNELVVWVYQRPARFSLKSHEQPHTARSFRRSRRWLGWEGHHHLSDDGGYARQDDTSVAGASAKSSRYDDAVAGKRGIDRRKWSYGAYGGASTGSYGCACQQHRHLKSIRIS